MLPEKMVQLGTARSVIRELFEFGKKRAAEVGAENVFDFSIGNPSVPPPEKVNEIAIDILKNQDPVFVHGYTSAQGDAGVRESIAASLSKRFGGDYDKDDIYMTTGAAAALTCCFNGLCREGEEVIVFAPYFPEYKVFIEKAGAKMVLIPAEIEGFQIDFDAFEKALNPNTAAVLVNTPNNPSGVVYSEDTVKKLADILKAKQEEFGHPIYLVSDEPYREIVYDGAVTPWIPAYYDNTIVTYSFSKSLSMPGGRIGYILVPKTVTDNKLVYAAVAGAGRSLGYVNAPALFQYIAAKCCEETSDLEIYAKNRRMLLDALREMGFYCVEPKGTFYLFPRCLEEDALAFSERAKQFDLLLVPGDGFGCPGHFRLAYCVPTERIERALPAFRKLAESYKK